MLSQSVFPFTKKLYTRLLHPFAFVKCKGSEYGSTDNEDPELCSEMLVVDLELAEEEEEEQIIAPDEEFAVRKDRVDSQLEELKDKKVNMQNMDT